MQYLRNTIVFALLMIIRWSSGISFKQIMKDLKSFKGSTQPATKGIKSQIRLFEKKESLMLTWGEGISCAPLIGACVAK